MSLDYRATLLQLMQSEFAGNSFNGPNLIKTLHAIPFDDLTRTDTYENYTVLNVTLHIIFWKIAFTKGIGGTSTVEFLYEGENWPVYPDALTPEGWTALIELLKQSHAEQIAAVKAIEPTQLAKDMPWGCSIGEAIVWIATHDTYHIAQIRNMGLPEFHF